MFCTGLYVCVAFVFAHVLCASIVCVCVCTFVCVQSQYVCTDVCMYVCMCRIVYTSICLCSRSIVLCYQKPSSSSPFLHDPFGLENPAAVLLKEFGPADVGVFL